MKALGAEKSPTLLPRHLSFLRGGGWSANEVYQNVYIIRKPCITTYSVARIVPNAPQAECSECAAAAPVKRRQKKTLHPSPSDQVVCLRGKGLSIECRTAHPSERQELVHCHVGPLAPEERYWPQTTTTAADVIPKRKWVKYSQRKRLQPRSRTAWESTRSPIAARLSAPKRQLARIKK